MAARDNATPREKEQAQKQELMKLAEKFGIEQLKDMTQFIQFLRDLAAAQTRDQIDALIHQYQEFLSNKDSEVMMTAYLEHLGQQIGKEIVSVLEWLDGLERGSDSSVDQNATNAENPSVQSTEANVQSTVEVPVPTKPSLPAPTLSNTRAKSPVDELHRLLHQMRALRQESMHSDFSELLVNLDAFSRVFGQRNAYAHGVTSTVMFDETQFLTVRGQLRDSLGLVSRHYTALAPHTQMYSFES